MALLITQIIMVVRGASSKARIERVKKHLLKITEIPFGTTTTSLIDSILSANDKSKIKISKIEDNTAEFVEIWCLTIGSFC